MPKARERSDPVGNGRHRRDLDRLADHVRGLAEGAGADQVRLDSELLTLAGLADRADEMEADPSSSDQTYVLVLSRFHEIRREVVDRFGRPSSGSSLSEVVARLFDPPTP